MYYLVEILPRIGIGPSYGEKLVSRFARASANKIATAASDNRRHRGYCARDSVALLISNTKGAQRGQVRVRRPLLPAFPRNSKGRVGTLNSQQKDILSNQISLITTAFCITLNRRTL